MMAAAMPRPSAYPEADEATGGRLAELLHLWHDVEGLSFERIAVRLREFGVTPSGETVRQWWLQTDE
jgi:hypothetical protein